MEQWSCGAPLDPRLRVTINFHPDLLINDELLIQKLVRDRSYQSQFLTGISNGGLTAFRGGDRWNWESRIFGAAYDAAPDALRPKYGALNYERRGTGASPRFGSCHLRLAEHTLDRCTFCYPDSHLEPSDFGTKDRMNLIEKAKDNVGNLDVLDNYVEAHVHGPVSLNDDIEAVVLDPTFKGTQIEDAADQLGVPVEWHAGYRLPRELVDKAVAYRGPEIANYIRTTFGDKDLVPADLIPKRQAADDFATLKKVWHCIAKFGDPDAFAKSERAEEKLP